MGLVCGGQRHAPCNVDGFHALRYQGALTALEAGETLLLDGAVGSELPFRGADLIPQKGWSALANEDNPSMVCRLHSENILAGAQIITCNTFTTSRAMLNAAALGSKFESLNTKAVELAIQAREQTGAKLVLVAGSVTPVGDALGSSPASTVAQFEQDTKDMISIQKAAGIDLVLGEIMSDPIYSACVLRAAKANGVPIWCGLSATRSADGHVSTYATDDVPFEKTVDSIVSTIEEVGGCDVVGLMHTKVELVSEALSILRTRWKGPLMVYPDHEIPMRTDSQTLTSVANLNGGKQRNWKSSAEEFCQQCFQWKSAGVQVFGGGSGIPPTHIQTLAYRLSQKGR